MPRLFTGSGFFLAAPLAPFVFLQDFGINRDFTDFPAFCYKYFLGRWKRR
jgi:hypothetical protein